MGNLQSLSELYQNRLFRIPDYQRGYAWKKNQLIDFWDDIINLQEGRYHYTGLLSLKAVPRSETKLWEQDQWLLDAGYKAYHIVDGQQRLTTFSILMNEIIAFITSMDCHLGKSEDEIVICYQTLKSIREKYISRKRPPQNFITTYLFGYEVDNPSAEYLIHKVYNEPYSGAVNETYYTQNLKYAKNFFADCLEKLYEVEGLGGIEGLFRKLTLSLMFNIHEIEDDYDVFVAFETMNNRGKKLTNLELLKNRLIYLTTLYDDDQLDETDKSELRKQINEAWKEIYFQLGRNQHAPLSDDEFLRAHWIIYFQYTRKKGNDYITYLLNKFSAKNIFAKHVTGIEEDIYESIDSDLNEDLDDDIPRPVEQDIISNISNLLPHEIATYVNSLKDVAKYWFYTHFPNLSQLSYEEKIWLERLNRVGIGYFRPLVTATLAVISETDSEKRIKLFQAIERFIFLTFRMAGFQSSYKSSVYNGYARDLYVGNIAIEEVTNSLIDTVNQDMEFAINNFMIKIDKRFSNGSGFYSWHDLRYLLFEYEFEKAKQTGITKLGWAPFTTVEKDKVSIEHILPQTPTKWYWRNQFRQYTQDEIKILSASLGNLLPLSQSVNSALQNDSFEDKKTSQTHGRRGYQDGSHSELEVSHEIDWDAVRILERGLNLLSFIEKRWDLTFKDESQKIELLHLDFVNEERQEVPELPQETVTTEIKENLPSKTAELQVTFWTSFVRHCEEVGRKEDIGSRKPFGCNWYDVSIGRNDCHIFFTIIGKSTINIGLYLYDGDIFARFEQQKEAIEEAFGDKLEWYTSRKNTKSKRVIYSKTTEIYNGNYNTDNFNWFIECCDKLKEAIEISGV